MDFLGDGDDLVGWTAKPIVTVQCPGPCEKMKPRLGKDYVVEQCLYEIDGVETRKVHVVRYSDPEPQVYIWDYSTPGTTVHVFDTTGVTKTKSSPTYIRQLVLVVNMIV